MSDHDPFPNVKDKLTAPTKKSAFEKSRLEAEAKRLREEAETAAVLKDFVASFDEPEPPLPFPSSSSSRGSFRGGARGGGGGGGGGGGIGRRHFTAQPPPAALQRKRNLEAAFERDGDDAGGVFGGVGGLGEREKRRLREGNVGLLAFENSVGGAKDDDDDDSDSETSKPHPKPTLSLTSLPPSTTKPILTALLASTPLRIDSIRIIPAPPPPGPSQPSPSIRKAASALITLSPETPSSDIDAAVTTLNGRYLGTGFWLTISRHLPSTISTTTPLPAPTTAPFNATAPTPSTSTHHRHHHHRHRPPPPPAHRGGFAPPPNYRAPNPSSSSSSTTPATASLQVHVAPPNDIRQLRLIHKTLEALITHGPAFEALLMASDDVRSDARFAWLWDARSPAGVYYRWKLWSLVTGQHRPPPAIEVFEPTPALAALWIPPRRALRYEFAGAMRDVREDSDFSSEELLEDDEDEGGAGGGAAEGVEKRGYLGVLGRAKLVHLVARVPTQTMKVRRGDVGRVMAFAMEHAEGGMGEEVVDVLVGNVLRPLAFTRAAKGEDDDEEEKEKEKEEGSGEKGAEETHAAKIVALWIISDVLSNSSLGIRNAWRYRQLFDVALRERGVFAHLGEVYRTPGWGRMKAEKFRRGVVEGVLEWWEKWCIFPQTTQDAFLTSFLTPPTPPPTTTTAPRTTPNTSTSTPSTTTKLPTTTTATTSPAPKSKWKTVETTPSSFNPLTADQPADSPTSDVDGEPMVDDDDDVDGEPMLEDDEEEEEEEEDNDGEPMQEDDDDGQEDNGGEGEEEEEDDDGDRDVKEMFDDGAAVKPSFSGGAVGGSGVGGVAGGVGGGGVRKRMRAEDMFADEE
ncbi:uncharacterized protein LAJ45_04460 [Morchella importuna]|uniref:uncharacterized protein n=1 Tax=Morchella importuna TaxID=1174673 RepID=UPI001E8D2E0B|nr:uncharacterized protein LAJ45_04460 [Morchella importuna]KAH8151258.1 hypothetical protein LAJ45_04460 [Morchella importuna]